MDPLTYSLTRGKNSMCTNINGWERNNYLLMLGLNSLLHTEKYPREFKRIFHVVQWDSLVTQRFNEALLIPYKAYGFSVGKIYDNETDENKSDSPDDLKNAQVIICTLRYVFDTDALAIYGLDRNKAAIIFDNITLDALESVCCDVYNSKKKPEAVSLPCHEFGNLDKDAWVIILVCNRPTEGLEIELGIYFVNIYETPFTVPARSHYIFSAIIHHGPNNVPMLFGPDDKVEKIHQEVGQIVQECLDFIPEGILVVFFPSYGKMLEFHNAFEKMGLWDKIKVPHIRENRGEGKFRDMLCKLSTTPGKSIAFVSHRFHQEIVLADIVFSSRARLLLSVGTPYPFINETWTGRMKYNDNKRLEEGENSERLSGKDLYLHRGMDYLNYVIRKFLHEWRSRDLTIVVLDKSIPKGKRLLLTPDIGHTHVGDFRECLAGCKRSNYTIE